jgi:oxalate decarboxylase/phosphoglucose isomerase-like protein (cupin superfamily)
VCLADDVQAEWGFVYNGSILVSAVDENGAYQVAQLGYGDIWYFPKGIAHTIQGLGDENEYLLVFDDADFDKIGWVSSCPIQVGWAKISRRTTFMVDDWLEHTPSDVIAKNFGVNISVFNNLPAADPYILNGTVSTSNVTGGPVGALSGNSSFVYHTLQHPGEKVPGGGGEFYKIDSTYFPIAQTIAATFVRLVPGGLRELHWHPNVRQVYNYYSAACSSRG